MTRSLVSLLLLVGASIASAQTPPKPGAIAGTGCDSLRGGPLKAAVVQLKPLDRDAITNEKGEFTFADVPPGRYSLRVLHAELDRIGMAIVTPEFAVESGATVPMSITVPGIKRIVQSMCPPAQLLR